MLSSYVQVHLPFFDLEIAHRNKDQGEEDIARCKIITTQGRSIGWSVKVISRLQGAHPHVSVT